MEPAEGAMHWYDFVYRPVVTIAMDSGVASLLSSSTEADLFLMVRRGSRGPMDHGWQISAAFAEKSRNRLRAAAPGRIPATIKRVTGPRNPGPRILPKADVDPIPTRRDSPAPRRRPHAESSPPEADGTGD